MKFYLVLPPICMLLGIGGAGEPHTPQFPAFEHYVIDLNPPSADGCCLDVAAVGDIDGDGIVDVMVGSQNSVGAVWYHAPDWRRYAIGEGEFTTDGEIYDLDGDGDGDVVISCISRDQIEWWENTGDPFNGGWIRHAIGALFAHDISVADLNGDGRPDVAVFKKGKQKHLAVYLAPPERQGQWEAVQVATPAGEGLDMGDLDGDGDADIAASRTWYENVGGDGRTWQAHTIDEQWGVDCRDIIADMNDDGRMDVVLSHSEGKGGVSWFENPGWTEHPIEAGTLVGAHTLEVADFDRDGDPDAFTGEMHTSPEKRVLVYENLGNNAWRRIVLSTDGIHNGRISDLDNDGDVDIMGKNYDGPKVVEIWENTLLPHSENTTQK